MILDEIPKYVQNPSQLRACYTSLGKIYETKGQADLSRKLLHKATELNGQVEDYVSTVLE